MSFSKKKCFFKKEKIVTKIWKQEVLWGNKSNNNLSTSVFLCCNRWMQDQQTCGPPRKHFQEKKAPKLHPSRFFPTIIFPHLERHDLRLVCVVLWQPLPDELLYPLVQLHVVLAHEGDGLAGAAGPRGAPDPVGRECSNFNFFSSYMI